MTGLSPEPPDLANRRRDLAMSMWWLFASAGALMGPLALYAGSIGIGAGGVAFLYAVISGVGLLTGQLWGYVADLHVSRTRLLLFQALGCAVVVALVGFLPKTLWALALGLAAYAFFSGSRSATLNSVIFASRGGKESYGPIRLTGSIGFVVMTLLVGFLADWPAAGIGAFWMVVLVCEGFFIFSLVQLKDHDPKERLQDHPPLLSFRQAQRHLLKTKVMRWFLLFTLVTQLAHTPGVMMQVPLLREFGASNALTMGAMALAPAAEVLVFLFGRQLLARSPILLLMFLGAAATAVRWLLVWYLDSPGMVTLTNVLHMFTFGVAYLAGVTFIDQEAPRVLRSSAQTIFSIMFFSLPMLVGNLVTAAVLRFVSLNAFFGFSGLFALAALLTFIPLARAVRRQGR